MAWRGSDQFMAFGEQPLRDILQGRINDMAADIANRSESYILNVSEDKFIEYLKAAYSVEPPTLDFDAITVSHSEQEFRAEDLPRMIVTRPGGRYKRMVVNYFIPLTGNSQLLRYQPDQYSTYHPRVHISRDGYLCLSYPDFSGDAERIKRDANSEIRVIRDMYSYMRDQIESHNRDIPAMARQTFQGRKQEFLRRNNFLEKLGVPLKKRGDLPETFAIPKPETPRRVVPAPVVTEKGYKPDPTLQDKDYQDILQVIHDSGRVMEQHPSIYRDKDEESIRDLFLFQLAPRFEGSTTGETFNASGKTDILMSYEGGIAFVAECKFWSGPAAFVDKGDELGPISQLLSYLTWRESKTALLIFVRNKEITPVVEKVRELVSQHPNFLRLDQVRDESWVDYRMHLNGDKNREMKMAVMLFHLPEA